MKKSVNPNILDIFIQTISTDVQIEINDRVSPYVELGDNFKLIQEGNKLTIEESNVTNCINTSFGKVNVFSSMQSNVTINGTTISISNGNVCIKNMNMTSKADTVRLILNTNIQRVYSIHTTSGDIDVRDLQALRLDAQTVSGNINMRDSDIVTSQLRTTSGNVNMSLIDSQLNYDIRFQSTSGNINSYSTETVAPTILENKKNCSIATTSGSAAVNFKGANERTTTYSRR